MLLPSSTIANLSSSNVTNYLCFYGAFDKNKLNGTQLNILLAFNIILITFTVVVNALIVVAIKKTNQARNIAIKLFCYLFTWQLFSALLLNPICIVQLISDTCWISKLGHLRSMTCDFISIGLMILIGFDRYIRIKYPLQHKYMITKRRIKVTIIVIVSLAIVSGIISTLSKIYNLYILQFIIMVVFIILVCCIYVLIITTISLLKKVKKSSYIRNNGNSKIEAKMIQFIALLLVLGLLLFTPSVLIYIIQYFAGYNLAHLWMNRFMFAKQLCYLVTYLHFSLDSILFLKYNKQCKLYIKNMFVSKPQNKNDPDKMNNFSIDNTSNHVTTTSL